MRERSESGFKNGNLGRKRKIKKEFELILANFREKVQLSAGGAWQLPQPRRSCMRSPRRKGTSLQLFAFDLPFCVEEEKAAAEARRGGRAGFPCAGWSRRAGGFRGNQVLFPSFSREFNTFCLLLLLRRLCSEEKGPNWRIWRAGVRACLRCTDTWRGAITRRNTAAISVQSFCGLLRNCCSTSPKDSLFSPLQLRKCCQQLPAAAWQQQTPSWAALLRATAAS